MTMRDVLVVAICLFAFGAGFAGVFFYGYAQREDALIKICVEANIEPKKCLAIGDEIWR